MFETMSTADIRHSGPTKTLLYSHHGWGKTYQCRYYEKRYGSGLILSGESGLKSVEDVDIDYVPFTSWDGEHDPAKGKYSFVKLKEAIQSPAFAERGYKWIAIDSLTELSERLFEYLEEKHKNNPNNFEIWGDYSRLFIGALKWVRDLPYHIYVTCLAKESDDDNGNKHYWPNVKGNAVSQQVPALFDHVLCGVRTTEKTEGGKPRVKRYIVTDEIGGWHGKTRDPLNRIRSYEEDADVTALFARMSMGDEEYQRFQSANGQAN